MRPATIPLTVLGGYLGAGKTTLLNHLLRNPGGRRIGVIVNDFGSLAIDAELLGEAAEGGVVSLANGCACCTVGAGLHEALAALVALEPPPDHIVVEVSGVADPAVAAGWGTVAPFEPAGVIVLADATSVVQRSRDRYVGSDITRQFRGADLVVVTKTDTCDQLAVEEAEAWLGAASGGAPSTRVIDGRIPPEVILDLRPDELPPALGDVGADAQHRHVDRYESSSWTSSEPVGRDALDRFIAALPVEVLRVKGRVQLDDGSWVRVQVVGRRVDVTPDVAAASSQLVAIAVRRDRPAPNPFALHFG